MINTHDIKGTLRPLQDWLILAPEHKAEKIGNILLPDNARTYGRCPVVAAGPDCELKVGQVVYLQKFVDGEFKFTLNGRTVFAIRERHCSVIIEGEDKAVDSPKKKAKKSR